MLSTTLLLMTISADSRLSLLHLYIVSCLICICGSSRSSHSIHPGLTFPNSLTSNEIDEPFETWYNSTSSSKSPVGFNESVQSYDFFTVGQNFRTRLNDIGDITKYRVFSIIGRQQSGKSYLLNTLFDLKFLVKEGPSGYAKLGCSLEICTEPASISMPILLLDFEGIEGRERDFTDLDSRTVSLAVAASDVLIINLWAQDVMDNGRNSIFPNIYREVAKHQGNAKRVHPIKVLVLFRDVEDSQQLISLVKSIRQSVQTINTEFNVSNFSTKPTALNRSHAGPDVEYFGLPHMKFRKKAFDKALFELRSRLIDLKSSQNTLNSDSEFDSTHEETPRLVPINGHFSSKFTNGKSNSNGIDENRVPNRVPLKEIESFLSILWEEKSAVLEDISMESSDGESQDVRLTVAILACVDTARPLCLKLEKKVSAAALTGVPILEFGTDAKAILRNALNQWNQIMETSKVSINSFGDVRDRIGRLLESAYAMHILQLRILFEDRFDMKFEPLNEEKNSQNFESYEKLVQDVETGFGVAANLASPPEIAPLFEPLAFAEMARLRRTLDDKIADRISENAALLSNEDNSRKEVYVKRAPRWKVLLLRAFVVALNYAQATQGIRAARRESEKRQKRMPHYPLF